MDEPKISMARYSFTATATTHSVALPTLLLGIFANGLLAWLGMNFTQKSQQPGREHARIPRFSQPSWFSDRGNYSA